MVCLGKKWLKKQSLVFKISLSVLGCSFLGLVILLGIVTKRSETIIKEQIMEHSVHTIKASVDNVTHLVQETEQAVRSLRNTLNALEADDVEAMEIALISTIKAIHTSGLDLSHAAIYTFPAENSVSGMFYSAFANDDGFSFKSEYIDDFGEKLPWFNNIVREAKIVWSEPYISPNSPKQSMVITCILPFRFQKQSTFTGIVSISVDLRDIQQYIESSPFSDDGELVLLSKNGLYITHPNPEINLKTTIYELAKKLNNPKLFQIGEEVLSGKSGYTQMPFSSVYGAPTIFFYAPVPHLDWGICLIYSQAALFKPVYDLQIMIIISTAAGILILLFLINKICHYSTRPLQSLARIATQYGEGNFSELVSDLHSDDEIGTLSAAFHNMRSNLLEYIAKEKQDATEKQKNLSELEIAKQIQNAALPAVFPEHKAFDIHALMIPARQIGGDFYDFFFLNKHKIALVMADVSGKGISAALYMMRAQEVIKHTAQYTHSVVKVFERANNILCEGNKACMFVTAFFAVINLENGEMEFVNAGHLPPFLIDDTGCRKITPQQNFVLGVREGMAYKAEKIKLRPNSRIFLYTDGITEAENRTRDFYGEERLYNVLQRKQATPAETVKDVITDIRKFTEGAQQSDDITMLSFLYRGAHSDILKVEADVTQLRDVLGYIERDMAQKKIAPEIRSKMIVIAEELFTNIALYAYENGGIVRIQTALYKNRYSVIFTDSGKPYNPLERQEPDTTQPLAEREVGGLGIFIARKMADALDYTYKNGENVLKVEISIKKDL